MRLLQRLTPGLLAVQVPEVAALKMLVHLGGDEAGEQFLGERVVRGDSLALAVVLVHPHRLEARRTREQFVGDARVILAAIYLAVRVLGEFVLKKSHVARLAAIVARDSQSCVAVRRPGLPGYER